MTFTAHKSSSGSDLLDEFILDFNTVKSNNLLFNFTIKLIIFIQITGTILVKVYTKFVFKKSQKKKKE